MSLQVGSTVERYTVEGVIGRGGMATVLRVRHNTLETLHAMKVLDLPTASMRRRLLQEGQLQGGLCHPNVVSVTDVVTVQLCPALVMELVEGCSLESFWSPGSPWTRQTPWLAGFFAAWWPPTGTGSSTGT